MAQRPTNRRARRNPIPPAEVVPLEHIARILFPRPPHPPRLEFWIERTTDRVRPNQDSWHGYPRRAAYALGAQVAQAIATAIQQVWAQRDLSSSPPPYAYLDPSPQWKEGQANVIIVIPYPPSRGGRPMKRWAEETVESMGHALEQAALYVES